VFQEPPGHFACTAVSFGLPVETIFIILGIDVLMDMARTSVNVIGNCLATAVIARSENEFNDEVARNLALNRGKYPKFNYSA